MKGEVVYLYAFDVANEIITSRVQEILSEKPFPFEIRMDRTLPKDMPLYKPLAIEPHPLPARLHGAPVRLLIRVYDVGVVTVMMRAAFETGALADLMPFHNPKLENGLTLDAVALKLCAEVCDSLKDLLVGRTEFPPPPEAYTVFCLTDLGGVNDANRWLGEQRREVAGLLTETAADQLSEAQVTEVLRIQRSFENTDLAVIDWDAALVVDLTGYVDDVLYALELANLQLEEFRVMDRRLDAYLDRAYEDLERRPHAAVRPGVHDSAPFAPVPCGRGEAHRRGHAYHQIFWRLASRPRVSRSARPFLPGPMARQRGAASRPARQALQCRPHRGERAEDVVAGNHHRDFLCAGFVDSVAGRAVTRQQLEEKRFVTSPIQALTTQSPPNLPNHSSANRSVVQWSSPWSRSCPWLSLR